MSAPRPRSFGRRIARSILMPLSVFFVAYTFTSNYRNEKKIMESRGITNQQIRKTKNQNELIVKTIMGDLYGKDKEQHK